MDPIIDALANDLAQRFKQLPDQSRLLVGIAGAPGSGKSTIAYPLADRVNTILETSSGSSSPESRNSSPSLAVPSSKGIARCIGLDGWHLSRAELAASPNPEEAFFRRGAPFTYDMEGYSCFVKSARTNVFSPVDFPTFEHHIKDPVPSPTPLLPSNRIVIIEGLYTILDQPGWSEISEALDVTIYVDVSREIARERLIRRNFAAGIADTLEGTIQRVDESDMVNGDLVRTRSKKPTFFITGVHDEAFEG